MHPGPARSRWHCWWSRGRILVLGMVLGLVEFPLLSQPHWWAALVALIVLLYLLIPAFAGYMVARHSRDTSSGRRAGCLVGGISFLALAGTIALFPPPDLPPPSGEFQFLSSLNSPMFLISGILPCGGLGSAVGGMLGGAIGALGRWRAARLNRAATPPSKAPSEKTGT